MVLSVTAGLATSNFKQVEETAGVKVSAKTGFSFLGAANELSMEAECQLKTTTNTMTSTQDTTSTTIQRQYTGRQAPSRSHLVPRDRFVLERLNGQKVVDWIIRNPDRMIADVCPPGN
ncbi:hypothetical protein [Streptomyces sp. NBC_00271]|uniref:hypothetical protein n=1 Tax=Streptomyces sp. NBC_00271 TaxID=2975697 RepID=UPI002E28E412|nr:hypothetical protein [Streptomyces sp. NBC_00271]